MVINDLDIARRGKRKVRGRGPGDFLAGTIHE